MVTPKFLFLTFSLYRHGGGIILRVVYGYSIDTDKADPLVKMADTTVILIVRAFQPAGWLVDLIPMRECVGAYRDTLLIFPIITSPLSPGLVSRCWV